MTDDGERPMTATTDDGDDRRWLSTAKKSRPLILLKILDFRKIASFWKTAKIWFFSKVPPLDEKVEMTDDGDDRRRRRPTTTVDGDKISSTHFAKNLGFQKNCEFFWKTAKIWFFSKVPPLDEKGKWRTTANDRWRRRPTTTVDGDKISSTHFAKNLGFQKNCEFFWKTAKIWFFSKVPPLDEKGKWRTTANDRWRRRPTTTVDGDKISSTHFAKNLGFQKNCEFFWKTAKIWFFSKVPPLDEKGKWRTTANDRRRDDGDDRNLSTAIKSRPLILLKILDFRKIASFWKTAKIWFFSKVPPLDEKVEMTDDGDDGRRRRPTTTVDGDKISSTHFAKNLGFQKNCEFFWKTAKIWFFSKVPPLDEKGKWRTTANDRWRRRPTTATTDDDCRRR